MIKKILIVSIFFLMTVPAVQAQHGQRPHRLQLQPVHVQRPRRTAGVVPGGRAEVQPAAAADDAGDHGEAAEAVPERRPDDQEGARSAGAEAKTRGAVPKAAEGED